MPNSFEYFTFPANLTQVTLDGQDVSNDHLLEVAVGPECYGYVLSKMELPGRRMKTQIDGQIMTHTYWGTIGFTHIYTSRIESTRTRIVTRGLYLRRLSIQNTADQAVTVGGTVLNPGDELIRFVQPAEMVYAQSDHSPVELTVTLMAVSP